MARQARPLVNQAWTDLNYVGLRPPAGRCPGRLKAPRASTLIKSAFGLLRSAFGLARTVGSLGCRQDICCVCREDICCIKSQDICCSSRKDTRHLNEIDDTLGGRLRRPPRVWWMRLRCLVSFLLLQQMSWLLMQQMSSLQTQQISCLQPKLLTAVFVQQKSLAGQAWDLPKTQFGL